MPLEFKKAKNKKDIKNIFEHNIDAFSDSPDFKWTYEEICQEVDSGWELNAVISDDEIIAATFHKIERKALHTKNTAIKPIFKGSGYSHEIKEFFEKIAIENKLSKILHYCAIDNFRQYSLNESHEYSKIGALEENPQVVVWEKVVKK